VPAVQLKKQLKLMWKNDDWNGDDVPFLLLKEKVPDRADEVKHL